MHISNVSAVLSVWRCMWFYALHKCVYVWESEDCGLWIFQSRHCRFHPESFPFIPSVCVCVRYVFLYAHISLTHLSLYSFLLLIDCLYVICSVQYICICRADPTGLMGSIGVHWTARMAALAWQPVLLLWHAARIYLQFKYACSYVHLCSWY